MEKERKGEDSSDEETALRESISQHQDNNYLLSLIPKSLKAKYAHKDNPEKDLYNCISNFYQHSKLQQLSPFFNQIGINLNAWAFKSTPEQKTEYIMDVLNKNIQESIKKVEQQANLYTTNTINQRTIQKNTYGNQKQKGNEFSWLTLNTPNQMLKPKLKIKLVQTINQFKNQKRLRDVMGKQLEEHQKIHLDDDEIDLYQDEMSKINYDWTSEDEEMFIQNIKNLKQKFLQTPFLINCHRYKFITQSEIKTLASEEISRKLDKNNKAFLSRQFLLDKYFSTKETLTEKQMKFILKTSPLLSRCVDKAFVRSAVKNIQYEDIDKMELKIAEEIIEKFETIRHLVKDSRKSFKQKQNDSAKQRIHVFEKMSNFQQMRATSNQNLQKHKLKMIRNLNYRPVTAANNTQKQSKQNKYASTININKSSGPHKKVWPVPLNMHHPSTGLFIRDCSQQINQQFNEYENSYLKQVFQQQPQNQITRGKDLQCSMVKFYTGGPLNQNGANRLFGNPLIQQKSPKGKQRIASVICEVFKTIQYQKQIMEKLNSYQLDDENNDDNGTMNLLKPILESAASENSRKTRKQIPFWDEDMVSSKKVNNSAENLIKQKILQTRQKAKMTVFVKKLLSLAAQNSYASIKALNVKFTSSQINTLDSKGNTALYYATKNKNADFIDYLLSFKADVNIHCSKGTTPLHNAFKSSNYSIICKCLSGAIPPNLNAIDEQGKTPLAYCCMKVLEMLGLQNGVVSVSENSKTKFDNNSLLCVQSVDDRHDDLEVRTDIRRKGAYVEIA